VCVRAPGTVVTPWTESIKTRTLDRHIEQSKISDFILGGKRISPRCSGVNGAILPMASSYFDDSFSILAFI
jgi:hypothetical protein